MAILYMQAGTTNRQRAVAHAATALLAAAAGWMAHASVTPVPPPPPSPAAKAPAPVSAGPGRPDKRPLVAAPQQVAVASQAAPAVPRTSAPAPALPSCTAAEAVDAARVLQALEHGSEAEQFQGLMLARSAGLAVAEPLLKRLFETGASERVQIAAFESYLALRADRPDALRTALEQAQHASPPSIQQDARQRLAELAELQRLDALPPLTDP